MSQAFPAKPLRLVVTYATGGATDIIARAAAAEMSKSLGQTVVVENRPGAGDDPGRGQALGPDRQGLWREERLMREPMTSLAPVSYTHLTLPTKA